MNEPVRVMIVDDHEVVRRSLTTVLSFFDDLQVVGEAVDGLEAIELIDILHPDVILMDILMPGMDGLAATRAILAKSPETRILVLTSQILNGVPEAACEAGALGCISKDVATEKLAEALRYAASEARLGRYFPNMNHIF